MTKYSPNIRERLRGEKLDVSNDTRMSYWYHVINFVGWLYRYSKWLYFTIKVNVNESSFSFLPRCNGVTTLIEVNIKNSIDSYWHRGLRESVTMKLRNIGVAILRALPTRVTSITLFDITSDESEHYIDHYLEEFVATIRSTTMSHARGLIRSFVTKK